MHVREVARHKHTMIAQSIACALSRNIMSVRRGVRSTSYHPTRHGTARDKTNLLKQRTKAKKRQSDS